MRTWFITGVSSGFGRALAERLVERGERVVGTFRNDAGAAAFDALAPDRSFGVVVDVTDEAAVHRAIDAAEARIGGIDVLVNNAGFGLEGAVEEVTLDQARHQFEVNVFGPITAIQAVLPYMRKRRAGHIVNVSSMGGITTFPGLGLYHGSKFALEGISESLAKEIAPLGIKVTLVEPGGFRTQWAGASMTRIENPIDDYDSTVGAARKRRQEMSGRQPGDPRKAADAIIGAVDAPEPPLHLLLGKDALLFVGQKLGALQAEVMKWAPVSASTDFD
ncbi:oxidoreductase [Paraburkholderia sp.]|uniref:oxidoreductase n=1 Tax=Paraburkholderia sp. TaxID=1926495 RepID=UPI003D6FA253